MSASDHRSRQLRSSQFNGKFVLYWMVRDKRAHDNWALLEAQKIAIEQKVPLLVCFQFMGSYEKANIRQYQFLFEGLKEMYPYSVEGLSGDTPNKVRASLLN